MWSGQFQTEAVMISDAVILFANAFIEKDTYKLEFKTNLIDCVSFKTDEEPNLSGQAILDNINNVIDICVDFGIAKIVRNHL